MPQHSLLTQPPLGSHSPRGCIGCDRQDLTKINFGTPTLLRTQAVCSEGGGAVVGTRTRSSRTPLFTLLSDVFFCPVCGNTTYRHEEQQLIERFCFASIQFAWAVTTLSFLFAPGAPSPPQLLSLIWRLSSERIGAILQDDLIWPRDRCHIKSFFR